MKIAMVTPRYPPNIVGGGEISCEQLVKALENLGVMVDVISANVIFPKTKRKEKLFLKMYKYLKKRLDDYDILHAYNMNLLPTLGLLTKKYGTNTVGSLNGHVYSPTFGRELGSKPTVAYNFNSMMLQAYTRHIKRFTTLSKFYTDTWVNDGLKEEKITVIPNMIDENYTASKIRPRNDIVRLIAVGNYATWRNFEGLLQHYSTFPKQKVILTIVGQGWKDTVSKYFNLCKNAVVYYDGLNHQDLKDLFAVSNIYVQPYHHYGIGRTLLEAAQNNTAIVATGEKENYLQLEHGIKTVDELEHLIADKKEQRASAKFNKLMVNKWFNPKYIGKKYLAIYEELL